jgi:hypothetical protein
MDTAAGCVLQKAQSFCPRDKKRSNLSKFMRTLNPHGSRSNKRTLLLQRGWEKQVYRPSLSFMKNKAF